MQIPKLDPAECAYFSRVIVDTEDWDALDAVEKQLFTSLCLAAEQYMCNYTGLNIEGTDPNDLDNNEHLKYCGKVIVSSYYDNRDMVDEYANDNRLVKSVLNLHCVNYVPEEEE